MKSLVFQVNIKPNGAKTSGRKRFSYSISLYDLSNRRAEEYANKVGADYFCLSNTDWLGDNYAHAIISCIFMKYLRIMIRYST